MGNRGCLHDDAGEIIRPWAHTHWISCSISYGSRRAAINAPGRYSQLFFLDECVALASGHRPCAQCRRPQYHSLRRALSDEATPIISLRAAFIDRLIHRSRAPMLGIEVRQSGTISTLPDGSMFTRPKYAGAWLLWRGRAHKWTHSGYVDQQRVSGREVVSLLTPAVMVRALRGGYVPEFVAVEE